MPFRQSRLTQVLEESLTGKKCLTCVIGCVSCEEKDLPQTLNTLRYAESLNPRARKAAIRAAKAAKAAKASSSEQAKRIVDKKQRRDDEAMAPITAAATAATAAATAAAAAPAPAPALEAEDGREEGESGRTAGEDEDGDVLDAPNTSDMRRLNSIDLMADELFSDDQDSDGDAEDLLLTGFGEGVAVSTEL